MHLKKSNQSIIWKGEYVARNKRENRVRLDHPGRHNPTMIDFLKEFSRNRNVVL
jgi:hypothetical protein